MNAARWLEGLMQTISKLEGFAGYGPAPESEMLGCELRQIVFKSHRILYTVDANSRKILVHYVRHGARRGITELPGGLSDQG